ncbi:MAG: hypothetical protein ACRD2N_04075 [Vicinamibacterales bacterium]
MAIKRGRKSRNRLGDAAESFGRVLGALSSKVEQVNKQRAEVSKEIMSFVRSAQGMLSELGHQADLRMPKGRKFFTSPFATADKPGRKRGYKVSAAARRKMSLAAKRRWAAKRAEQKT